MPDWRAEIIERLAALHLPPAREAEIVEELSQHLEDRWAALRSRGVAPDEARRHALEELESADILQRELRSVEQHGEPPVPIGAARGVGFVPQIWQDIRYGVRTLRARPGFTAVATITLALGIGACTVIFSVVNGVLLRPLPYPDPDQLVTFWGTAPEKGLPEVDFPPGLFAVYRDRSRTLKTLAAYEAAGFTLTGAGDPERVQTGTVTTGFFPSLAVKPLLGRFFLAEEDTPDDNRVAIMSYQLWMRRFGGDSGIIGKAIALNDRPATIVGVMPPGFDFPEHSELWVPLGIDQANFNCWCLSTVARMKPGLTAPDVRREIARITDDFGMVRRDVFPDAKPGGSRVVVLPLVQQLVGDVRTPLYVLLGAVGLVLLIACANIANLLLARATARGREMALRCCLGATPRRIAAQLLTESLLLSVAGAAGGLLLARWGVAVVRQLPSDLVPRIEQVRLDPVVVAFTVGVALLTGVMFGLAPALRAARVDLQRGLRDGGRGTASGGNRRLSGAFVVLQFALSLVLLVGAGLLLESFRRMLAVDPGFKTENVLTARLQVPYPRYRSDTVVRAFYLPLLDRVRALPGVRAVGLSSRIPLSRGNPQDNVTAEGRDPAPGQPVLVANIRNVTVDYFAAIGTPIVRGRGFEPADARSADRVVVVDETLARHFWPNEDAVGKRIRHGGNDGPWLTIIGVTPNVKHSSLIEDPSLQVYELWDRRTTWTNYLVVRTTSTPQGLVAAVRAQVGALDPAVPLFEVRTMEEAMARSLSTRRLTNGLLTAFAAVALVLAAIGVYGVMSLNVSARAKELGIRIALGAPRRDVMGLVLRQGMALALPGVILGVLGAASLSRFIRSLLFGVQPFDAATFVAVAATLAAVALAACYVPARRAMNADPVGALRED